MKLVIIESPFAGKTKKETLRNIKYARECVKHSLNMGEAPIASHLLYTQPGILNDNIVEERNLGINAGLAWREVASKSVVYTDFGISKGMEYGIKKAKESGIEIEYRSIRLEDSTLISFINNQEELQNDMAEVLYDNLWGLYEEYS